MSSVRLSINGVQAVWAAALASPIAILLSDMQHREGIGLLALAVIVSLVSFGGRRLTGWILVALAFFRRRRKPIETPSEAVFAATVMPGVQAAVRWDNDALVALIELTPRAFTPTVIVQGRVHTDDVVDTRVVEHLLSIHCHDLEADIVSAGYRFGNTTTPEALRHYWQTFGSDAAPAYRRTWIVVRADPLATQMSARRRGPEVPGLMRYLATSTTRLADRLAGEGIDAACARSFDDYDRAVEIGFVKEHWASVQCRDRFASGYTATGGPDVWWSAPADYTITRTRVGSALPPRSCVLLVNPIGRTPKGFSSGYGIQYPMLRGQALAPGPHFQLPIGSAGVLIGQTPERSPIYMPFDNVDASVLCGDGDTFSRFAARAAAAGGMVTLPPQFSLLAASIGAEVGRQPKVVWPGATTYFQPHPGVERVTLHRNLVDTPRHRHMPLRPISTPEEDRYERTFSKQQPDSVSPSPRARKPTTKWVTHSRDNDRTYSASAVKSGRGAASRPHSVSEDERRLDE